MPSLRSVPLILSIAALTACNISDDTNPPSSRDMGALKDLGASTDLSTTPPDMRPPIDMADPKDADSLDMNAAHDIPDLADQAREDMPPSTDMSIPPDMGQPAPLYLIIGSGSWAGTTPGRIGRYDVDPTTGKLSNIKLWDSGVLPTFMTVDALNQRLHVVDEVQGRLRSYTLSDAAAPTANGSLQLNGKPVYISNVHHGQHLLLAYYSEGAAESIEIDAQGKPTRVISRVTPGPKTHAIIPSPDERYAFATSLEGDKIAQYILSNNGQLTPNPQPEINLPAGSGPRHITFHPNGRWLYLINELRPSLVKLDYNNTQGTLSPVQTIELYPSGIPDNATGADVHVHPSGRWIIATSRPRSKPGHLVVAPLDAQGNIGPITITETRGNTPRNMAISPDGNFVVVGNRSSNNLMLFRFDQATGALTFVEQKVPYSPFFVTYVYGQN